MSKPKFVWPCPVYQAIYPDGRRYRLSFGWRIGQPLDPGVGLRACDSAHAGDLWRELHGFNQRGIRWAKQVAFRSRYLVNPEKPKLAYIEHPSFGRMKAPAAPFMPNGAAVKLVRKATRQVAPVNAEALQALRDLLWAIEGDDRAPALDVAFDIARRLAKAA